MNHFLAASISWIFAIEAFAMSPPRHALPLETYTAGTQLSEKCIQLRIGVATNGSEKTHSVRVDSVLLCNSADCFRAHTPGFVNISDTSAGSASVIADAIIPVTTITDIYFPETTGPAMISGHIKLRTPVVMEQGFRGLQLLIGLDARKTKNGVMYTPTGVGNVYFNNEGELVNYLPSTQTVAKLSLGTTLTIPRGALNAPQVFHVGIHDRGDIYPKIDIYPYLKLKNPAIVETDAIVGGRSSSDMISPAGTPEERHLWAQPDDLRPRPRARVSLKQIGPIEPSVLEEAHFPRTSRSRDDIFDADATKSYATILANPIALVPIVRAAMSTDAAIVTEPKSTWIFER